MQTVQNRRNFMQCFARNNELHRPTRRPPVLSLPIDKVTETIHSFTLAYCRGRLFLAPWTSLPIQPSIIILWNYCILSFCVNAVTV